jgi:hypothetical protein
MFETNQKGQTSFQTERKLHPKQEEENLLARGDPQ